MHQHPIEPLLLARGMSFPDLVLASGLSSYTIHRIVRAGRRGVKVKVRPETAGRIAHCLRVSCHTIFGEPELTNRGRAPLTPNAHRHKVVYVEPVLCSGCNIELPVLYRKVGRCADCM